MRLKSERKEYARIGTLRYDLVSADFEIQKEIFVNDTCALYGQYETCKEIRVKEKLSCLHIFPLSVKVG